MVQGRKHVEACSGQTCVEACSGQGDVCLATKFYVRVGQDDVGQVVDVCFEQECVWPDVLLRHVQDRTMCVWRHVHDKRLVPDRDVG